MLMRPALATYTAVLAALLITLDEAALSDGDETRCMIYQREEWIRPGYRILRIPESCSARALELPAVLSSHNRTR
jgi:hypothetical protein